MVAPYIYSIGPKLNGDFNIVEAEPDIITSFFRTQLWKEINFLFIPRIFF